MTAPAAGGTPEPEPAAPEGRVGVFGGTFDPPHVAHLAAAAEARWVLGLDVVLLVVANDPWQKSGERTVTPAADRLALVRAAVDGVDGVVASDLEVRRGGPSYTIDTVDELLAGPGVDEVVVIVGWDAAAGLPTWHRADELRERVRFAVVDRPHPAAPDLPPGWDIEHVPLPVLDISSSELRRRLADGRPVDGRVPARVVSLIHQRGLYRGRAV